MVLLDAAVMLGVLGLVVYGAIRLLTQDQTRPQPQPPRRLPPGPTHWRPTHYDLDGVTHVVLRKVSVDGEVLDEHVVATVPVGDPGYDAAFLAAMSTARERRALFEAEDE